MAPAFELVSSSKAWRCWTTAHGYALPEDAKSLAFARSLASDLRAVRIASSVRLVKGTHTLFLPDLPDGQTLDPTIVRKAQTSRTQESRTTSQSGGQLHEAQSVQADLIEVRLQFCISGEDFETYNQCRQLQTVPNARRIGRQVRVLVFDDGQPTGTQLIGAFGLASPTYALACRDSFLGWRGTRTRPTKNEGLRRVMDLAVCVAVPPYSRFFGGKLLASLALTEEVASEFERKYSDPLLGLTTTCATGLHCPIFNRIMVRPGGLYRRIGETSGWTLSWVSSDTLRNARTLLPASGNTHDILSFSSKPLIVMRRALRHIGVPYNPLLRMGKPKAVYFGSVSPANVTALRTEGVIRRPVERLSTSEAIAFWRLRLLPKRVGSAALERPAGGVTMDRPVMRGIQA